MYCKPQIMEMARLSLYPEEARVCLCVCLFMCICPPVHIFISGLDVTCSIN